MSTEESLNKLLEEGNLEQLEVVSKGFHFIRDLVTKYANKKDLISINYKTDLKSGVRLDPVHHFTNDGLLDQTIYYYDSNPVIKVLETYEYNKTDEENTEVPVSKRGIHSRTKLWRYYFEDGTLDESDTEGTYKEKSKIYKTDIEGLVVGAKRRHNIQILLSQRAGTLLVIMGVFSGTKEVKDAMRAISATHSTAFTEYEKFGTEGIFEEIKNDSTYTWLDTYIPTDTDLSNLVTAGQMSATQEGMLKGAFAAYDLTNIQGMTIRNYFIEKLKGNTK